MKLANYSWKTSAAAIVAMLTAAGTLVLNPLLDNDPATVPNWSAFLPVFLASVGGLFARDDDRTSEQVGAK